jgi:hypothetical protein
MAVPGTGECGACPNDRAPAGAPSVDDDMIDASADAPALGREVVPVLVLLLIPVFNSRFATWAPELWYGIDAEGGRGEEEDAARVSAGRDRPVMLADMLAPPAAGPGGEVPADVMEDACNTERRHSVLVSKAAIAAAPAAATALAAAPALRSVVPRMSSACCPAWSPVAAAGCWDAELS